jgi:hypothetical protein
MFGAQGEYVELIHFFNPVACCSLYKSKGCFLYKSKDLAAPLLTSTKEQQENAEWTGAVIYVWRFIVPIVVSDDQVHSVQHPDWFRGPPSSLYSCLFPGSKVAGCQADHSPPSSAEVKNGGAIPPLPYLSPWHIA